MTVPHRVFISYANDSKEFADNVCSYLENNAIKCWIAPRDIRIGLPYAEQITETLKTSKVMILVLSQQANKSPFILSELTTAFSADVGIITVRKEDVFPSDAIHFLIQNLHWLDFFPPPYEPLFDKLLDAVQYLLARTADVPFGSQSKFHFNRYTPKF